MDILCVGMYRSCSTWQYNIASVLAEGRGGKRLGFVTGDHYSRQLIRRGSLRILKAHDAHPQFARALESGQVRAIYSIRDLRDVAFSLMHKWRIGFDEMIAQGGMLRLCLENDRFWSALPNVLIQQYRDLIVDPICGVEEIAACLGLTIDPEQARAIADRFSHERNLDRVRAIAWELRGRGVDLDAPQNALRHDSESLFHWNHLRTGRIGAWREEATPTQARALAEVCGDWLIERGYVVDHSWADEVGSPDAEGGSLEARGNLSYESRRL